LAARRQGVSLRRFCGWEPRSWTEYEHDELGRVVRSCTRLEPEWDDGQRLWMLALAYYEATLCRKCGHDLHSSTSTKWAWQADDPIECKSCTALSRSESAYATNAEGKPGSVPPEAMIHTVRKMRDYSPSEMEALWAKGRS
jgi:hypothetical protein